MRGKEGHDKQAEDLHLSASLLTAIIGENWFLKLNWKKEGLFQQV